MDQRTFETANSSHASIVKPIAPANVLSEFSTLALGALPQPSNPFEVDIHFLFTHLLGRDPSNAYFPHTRPRRGQAIEGYAEVFTPKNSTRRYVHICDGIITRVGPCTVGVLSAQIKNISGQSWGGFWQPKYGPLAGFVKVSFAYV